MTIHISWDDDSQTTLLIHFDSEWTWEDFHTTIVQITDLAHQVEHTVDVIFDLSVSHSVGSEALVHVRRWINLWPANGGFVAIVSNQLMITAVTSIIRRTTPSCRGTLILTTSLNEARRVLAERRNT